MKGKRLVAVFLSVMMVLSSMTSAVFAEDLGVEPVVVEEIAEVEEPAVEEVEVPAEVPEVTEEVVEVPEEIETEAAEEVSEEDTEEAPEEAPVEIEETVEVPVEETDPEEEVSAPVYPAQKFSGEANGIKVAVDAQEGAFPEGTTMTLRKASAAAVEAAAEALDAEKEDVKAVDITFTAEGQEVEPVVPINVSLKSDVIAEADEAVIVHVDDNNVAEVVSEDKIIEAETNTETITFEADSFSVYAIVPTDVRATYEFYVEGDTPVETQIVKAGDTLVEPAEPAGNGEFLGWYIGDEKVTFGVLSSVNAGSTVRVEARFANTVYVTFYDADRTSVVAVKKTEAGSVDTTDVTAAPNAVGTAFDGWALANGTKVGATYTASSDTALYPVFVSGHSLAFNANGDGATQTSTQYVKAGQTTVKPADPQRPGYRFLGWFVGPDDGAAEFSFGKALSADTTVYAQWEAADASFTVIIWKQKISDVAGSENKSYDYEASYVVNSSTGASVGVGSTYKAYTWEGFHYATCDDVKTVASDGSTVLNVYYDRNIITMTFKGIGETQYTYTATTNDGTSLYGYVNGQYVPLTRTTNSTVYLTTSNNSTTEYTGTAYTRSGSSLFGYRYTVANPPYNANTTYYTASGSKLYTKTRTTYVYTYNGVTYTGTRYSRGSAVQQKVLIGLYGQTLASQGYEWPAGSGGSKVWDPDISDSNTTFMDAFILPGGATNVVYTSTSSGSKYRYFIKQNIDGTWPSDPTNIATGSAATFTITDKYNGFTAYQYKKGSGSWTSVGNKNSSGNYGQVTNQSDGTSNALQIRFKRNTYKIDFVNGSATVGHKDYLYEAPLDEADAPTDLIYPGNAADAAHYTFVGWYADPQGTTPFDFSINMPCNNLVAYAKWAPEQLTVTYDANGGSADKASEDINYNAKANGAVATWEGHTFLGWETEDGSLWDFNSPVTENITLKAVWRSNSALHVAYTGVADAPVDNNTYIDGARAIVADYTDEANRFIGWANGSTVYYAGSVIDVNSANDAADGTGDNVVTLTAVFDELETTAVTFHGNGGTVNGEEEVVMADLALNTGIDLDTFTAERADYVFLGWSTTPDGSVEFEADGTTAEEIAVDGETNDLYAVWVGQFYVYHSSTTETESFDLVDSFDITALVPGGYLYGGYYSDYADKGTVYTGASSSWSAANAYTTPGNAMTPVAGTTYYLKEVPEEYAQASNYEIYHRATHVEKMFYLVTTIDDNNYSAVGFKVGAAETDYKSTLTSTLNISYTDPEVPADYYNSATLTAGDFNAVDGGLIAYVNNNTILTAGKSITYRPYYVTLDGIKVYGKLQRTAKSDRKVTTVTYDSITITNKYFW